MFSVLSLRLNGLLPQIAADCTGTPYVAPRRQNQFNSIGWGTEWPFPAVWCFSACASQKSLHNCLMDAACVACGRVSGTPGAPCAQAQRTIWSRVSGHTRSCGIYTFTQRWNGSKNSRISVALHFKTCKMGLNATGWKLCKISVSIVLSKKYFIKIVMRINSVELKKKILIWDRQS